MEAMDKLLIEVEQRGKSNLRRIEMLESTSSVIHKLATSVELMAQNIERMTQEIKEQGKRLTALENEPAERWNNMTRTIFTTVVSTLAGGIVGALVTLLFK